MAAKSKVLVFAGSLRVESYNKRLAKIAAEAVRAAGGEATYIDLRDYPLPVFDEDLEKEGLPANALKLKQVLLAHQGLLLACPEYNSSITAVLKNTIDWTSRSAPGEPALASYVDKVAALLSASPGALGGLRGLVHVRSILGNIQVHVMPDQLAISRAFEAFTPEGQLKDAKQQAAVEKIAQKLVSVVGRLHG